MSRKKLSRREFVAATALSSAALITAPYVRAYAAGKLSMGFWDHWVPGANEGLTKLCNEWAAKEKVDLKIDYITSQGNKLLLTITSESQAKSGHDVISLPIWYGANQAANLEPVDDIVQGLIAKYGAPASAVEYLGKQDGRSVAVPATAGSQMKGPCGRHRSVQAARGDRPGEDVSARCAARSRARRQVDLGCVSGRGREVPQGRLPVRHRPGQTADSADSAGALFAAHGEHLVDPKGNITVDSDAVRQAL